MHVLDHTLVTPRLRVEPVTADMAAAARVGPAAFAKAVGADAPPEWCNANLSLVARSVSPMWGNAPTRAVAVHAHEGVVVGDVRFEPSLRAQREFEIGYGIARSRRRQGYAVEATGAVIDWLFDTAAAETILAGCDAANVALVRTLRRLGFWLDSNPGKTFWWTIDPELRSATRA